MYTRQLDCHGELLRRGDVLLVAPRVHVSWGLETTSGKGGGRNIRIDGEVTYWVAEEGRAVFSTRLVLVVVEHCVAPCDYLLKIQVSIIAVFIHTPLHFHHLPAQPSSNDP
jgi:hypothetical protein